MTDATLSRNARIRQFLNAGIQLAEQASKLADPENSVTEDEFWVVITRDMMTHVSPMIWIGIGGRIETYAYESDCDVRSKKEIKTFKGIISQFLANEGENDKEACRSLRADLEAALALLPTA